MFHLPQSPGLFYLVFGILSFVRTTGTYQRFLFRVVWRLLFRTQYVLAFFCISLFLPLVFFCVLSAGMYQRHLRCYTHPLTVSYIARDYV